MLFAWQPGEVCPLCLPTTRGETWDPIGLTFRPTLASFSPERWIPTQRRDPLGLHLILDSHRPGWVHLLSRGFPPRAVTRHRQDLPADARDGDLDPVSAAASRSAPFFGVLFASGLLGWRHLRVGGWFYLACVWMGIVWVQVPRAVPAIPGSRPSCVVPMPSLGEPLRPVTLMSTLGMLALLMPSFRLTTWRGPSGSTTCAGLATVSALGWWSAR